MMKPLLTLICVILFSSCSTEQQNLSSLDSSSVFKSTLDSKLFIDDASNYSDTIYVIKNEHYLREYPLETSKVKIVYIDDLAENKTLNRPDRTVDRRERFEITKFDKSRDTVYFDLFNYGASESYEFKLKKVSGVWKVISERMSIVNAETNF